MALLDLIRRLVAAVADVVALLRAGRQAETLKAVIAAAQLKGLIDAMDKTRLARLRRRDADRDADRLRDDDGHRRE